MKTRRQTRLAAEQRALQPAVQPGQKPTFEDFMTELNAKFPYVCSFHLC